MTAAGWDPQVLELLRSTRVSALRFPGGNDVDRTDWRDLVDGAHGYPGRPERQTIVDDGKTYVRTTRVGYDAFAALAADVGAQSIIVLNLGDALLCRRGIDAAASHVAGLVAYLRAPVGTKLPPGMPDWPALRAANGHPEPYPLAAIQLGNETWWPHKVREVQAAIGSTDPKRYADHLQQCLEAYVAAVRAIDATTPLIVDGLCGLGAEQQVLRSPRIQQQVAAVAFHAYAPWIFGELRHGTTPFGAGFLPVDAIDADTWWRLLVGGLGTCDARGRNIAWSDAELALARELGYDLAITEWNWNGFDDGRGVPPVDFVAASVVGTAAFIHGLLRRSEHLRMACQSMLVGHTWDICGVRRSRDGSHAPFLNPQYAVTAAYRARLVGQFLDVDAQGGDGFAQPYATGNGMGLAQDYVAWIDVIACADGADTVLALVHRDQHASRPVRIDLRQRHAGAVRVQRELLYTLPEDQRLQRLDAVRVETAPQEFLAEAVWQGDVPPAAVLFLRVSPR